MTNTVLALSKACLHCTLIKVKMFNYKSSISPVFLVLSSSRTDKLADILLEMQPLRHVFTPPQAWSEPRLRWSDHFGRKRKARLWQKHKESQRRDVEPRRLFPAFIPHRGVSRGAGRGLWVGWVGQSVRDVSFKMLAWKPPSGKMWRESLISSMEMFTSSMCVRSDLRHSAPCVASMKGRRQTWGFKAADTTSLKQILKKAHQAASSSVSSSISVGTPVLTAAAVVERVAGGGSLIGSEPCLSDTKFLGKELRCSWL